MAASGASDDGDRLARKRQPAAPQEEESIAPSVSSGAPNYDDADFQDSMSPSVSSGAEEESMRSRSPRSEPQASGSGQKRQPAAPQPERQPAAPQPGDIEFVVSDIIEYQSAVFRPLLKSLKLEGHTVAEDLEGHDVAAMMLARCFATKAAASGATGGTGAEIYKDDQTFADIYITWAEGMVVIRSRPARGVAAGRARL